MSFTRPTSSSLCDIKKTFLFLSRVILLSSANADSTPVASIPESINSSMNNKFIGVFIDSNISLNEKLKPNISLFRSPLDKLSKSKSLPCSVISTLISFRNLT